MKGRIVLFFSRVWLLLATGVPADAQAQDTEWKALNAQVRELYRQGHYERALLLAEQALEFAEKNDGPEHFFVTTSLNNLAALHSILGVRALSIREKVYGPRSSSGGRGSTVRWMTLEPARQRMQVCRRCDRSNGLERALQVAIGCSDPSSCMSGCSTDSPAGGAMSDTSVMFSCLATISSPRSKSARAEPEMACR